MAGKQPRLWEEEFGEGHVWQRRLYDFPLWTKFKHVAKLRYVHRNPVKRSLVLDRSSGNGANIVTMPSESKGRVLINEAQRAPIRVRNVVGQDAKVAG